MKIDLYIPSDRHVLVTGATRSGKSYCAEQWLKSYKSVVKLDTKREFIERRREGKSPWIGLKEGKDFCVVEHLEELVNCPYDKIIYAPVPEEQEMEYYESFFKWIYDRENCVLWCDETMSFTTPTKYPKWFKNLLIMGASKNIGVWCCTQRPMGIPAIIGANCSYYLVFHLNMPQDKKKISEVTGCPDFLESPSKEYEDHQFYFYKMGDEKPILCKM